MSGVGGYRLWVPRWAVVSSIVLSIAGIGVSTYLTIAHFTSAAILACNGKGTVNCEKVTESPQSEIFGHLPVAVLGLAFFVVMLALSLPRVWQSGIPRIDQARVAWSFVGVGTIIYLIYAELYQIHAICLYCTGVHVLTFLLFVVALAAYYSSSWTEVEAPSYAAPDGSRIRAAERSSWEASMPGARTGGGRAGGGRAARSAAAAGGGRSVGRLVSRAARTGGGRASYRRNTPWNWWISMGLIVLVGITLVTYSRYERLHPAAAAPKDNTPPTLSDHWFEAYSYDICGTVEPPLPAPSTLSGITTKGDGVIHVAPLTASDTGKNATLGKFVSSVGLKLSETSLTYQGKTYNNGDKCQGQPGIVEVETWPNAGSSKGQLVTGNPSDLRLANGQLITIAFLARGTTIPKPPASAITAMQSASASNTTTTTAAPSQTVTPTPASTTPGSSAPASTTPTTAAPTTSSTAAP